MFLAENTSAPHVVYVGEGAGSAMTTHTISAVNEDSLRVLAGEEGIAEQIGTFTTVLVGGDGDITSTGTLDSYGYENNLMGNSLRFKNSISGVAVQSTDAVVDLSGGVESGEDAIGIGDNDEADFAPEPTVVAVQGGFLVDQNGSVVGEVKNSSSKPSKPSRPAPPRPPSAASPARTTRQGGRAAAQTPFTEQKMGRGLTLGELMDDDSTSPSTNNNSRGKHSRTKSDDSWIKKDDDETQVADVDQFSLERKRRERAERKGRGQNKNNDN